MGASIVREGAPWMEGNASMSKLYNTKLKNVQAAFDNVSRHGKLRKFLCIPDPRIDDVFTHIQGIVHTEDYVFLSHNLFGILFTGIIGVISKKKGELLYWFNTPLEDGSYSHPGGMQTIGDYLMVPVENSSHDQSYIHFYDLSTMTNKVPPQKLAYSLKREAGTGAAGITNYTSGGTEYYLLAAYDNGNLHFYKSNGKTIAEDDFAFTSLFEAKVAQDGYSSIALLTDINNGLHMIGFRTHSPELDPVDYMDLYALNIDKKTIYEDGKSRHMITEYGGIVGPAGVHFRFGAGLRIMSDSALRVFATQRNIVAYSVSTNGFPPK
jgi:hypothetical protein